MYSGSLDSSPTDWYQDKQTITFNYWQMRVKSVTKEKQIGWHFGRQSSTKRLMAPITTAVGGLMCFSYARLASDFFIFYFQIVSHRKSLPCLFLFNIRDVEGFIKVYASTITLIRTEMGRAAHKESDYSAVLKSFCLPKEVAISTIRHSQKH